jgi:glycosyltransferase involved in cell wall biosynthesis
MGVGRWSGKRRGASRRNSIRRCTFSSSEVGASDPQQRGQAAPPRTACDSRANAIRDLISSWFKWRGYGTSSGSVSKIDRGNGSSLLSPRARAVTAYVRRLIGEGRYGDLVAGVARVTQRAVVARAKRLAARHRWVTRLAIDAKCQRLSADGQIQAKPAFVYPGPSAPLLASIIIPCFNYGRFVNEAVSSALHQTISSLEVIVVDDGSGDTETIRVLETLKTLPRVRVVRQVNAGLPSARNTGIALAQGEYICCLDADDTLEPSYIELCIAVLELDRSAGFAYSWVQLFGDETSVWRTHEFDIREALYDNHIPASAVFRRDDWLAVGGYRPDMRSGYEDWEFWLRVAALGRRGRLIRSPLLNHRRHGRTMTHDAHSMRHALIEIIRSLNPQIFENPKLRRRIASVAPKSSSADALAEVRKAQVVAVHDFGPHVLVIVPWLANGGAEILLLEVLAHLKSDWRISIVTSRADDQALWARFRDITTDVIPLFGAFDERHWLSFVEHMIATRKTCVVLSSGSAFAYDALSRIKHSHPQVATVDILHIDLLSGQIRPALGATRFIDLHVAVSNSVAGSLATYGVPADRIITIRNGVDSDRLFNPEHYCRATIREQLGFGSRDFVVAWVGRLDEQKRPLAFLRIVSDFNKLADVKALMIGDGPLQRAVEKEIDQLHLKQRIARFEYIERTQMPEIYAAADVLVMTSFHEGLPFVALEAMAMGCPVAATRAGELETLILDGQNGWLAPLDRPEDLLGPLLLVFQASESMREQMRIGTRRTVTKTDLTLSAMRGAYGRLFRDLLNGNLRDRRL